MKKTNLKNKLLTSLLMCSMILPTAQSISTANNSTYNSSNVVMAAKKKSSNAPSISVSPEKSSKQRQGSKAGFYDLQLKPGETTKVQFKVFNSADKDVTVHIKVNDGQTSDKAASIYDGKGKNTKSLKYHMSDLVKVPSKIKVPAKKALLVNAEVSAPNEKLEGALVGGIRITNNQNTDNKETDKGTFSITNQIAYVLGVNIQNDADSFDKVKPDLKFGKVKLDVNNGTPIASMPISNSTNGILRQASISGEIFQDGSKKPLYDAKLPSGKVLPNTKFNWNVDFGKSAKTGNYTYKIRVVDQLTGKTWTDSQKFKITAKDAANINKASVTGKAAYQKSLITRIVLGLAAAAIVGLLILVYRLMKKNKENDNE